VKELACKKRGRPVRVADETVACTCSLCLAWNVPDPATPPPITPPSNQSGLASFIAHNCCNHKADGSCLRRTAACNPLIGKRCGWFETRLIPLTTQQGNTGALTHYPAPASLNPTSHARLCPDCGQPMRPRRRRCDACQKTHRKHSTRTAMAKARLM
jgi:hypothetical protein